jgi:hypothetical protein
MMPAYMPAPSVRSNAIMFGRALARHEDAERCLSLRVAGVEIGAEFGQRHARERSQ